MISNRLKLARSAAGLSLRELSERIDRQVTAQAIGKYERDEAMPRSGVLIALADALHVSVNYLTGDPGISLQSVEFRTKKVIGKRQEDSVRAMVIHRLERYMALEEILDLPSVHWIKPRLAPYPVVNDLLEADRAASNLRHEWGLGVNPIPDMADLLEDRGVKVLFCNLPTLIDGLTAHVRRDGLPDAFVILVNEEHTRDRQRLTIAHEIGHLVLDVRPGVNEEVAAYRFAGAFLMPEEVVWARVGKHRTDMHWKELIALKLLFGMSIQAITYRCGELGVISQALKGRMFDKFTDLGWRDPPYREPLDGLGERSGRFERLCIRALAEGVVSESRAAELLEMSVHDLNCLWERELVK